MTLGLIRFVATSARATGERGRAKSVSGRWPTDTEAGFTYRGWHGVISAVYCIKP
ncbi:hypothetical protein D3C71_1951490 [compost metagenome]